MKRANEQNVTTTAAESLCSIVNILAIYNKFHLNIHSNCVTDMNGLLRISFDEVIRQLSDKYHNNAISDHLRLLCSGSYSTARLFPSITSFNQDPLVDFLKNALGQTVDVFHGMVISERQTPPGFMINGKEPEKDKPPFKSEAYLLQRTIDNASVSGVTTALQRDPLVDPASKTINRIQADDDMILEYLTTCEPITYTGRAHLLHTMKPRQIYPFFSHNRIDLITKPDYRLFFLVQTIDHFWEGYLFRFHKFPNAPEDDSPNSDKPSYRLHDCSFIRRGMSNHSVCTSVTRPLEDVVVDEHIFQPHIADELKKLQDHVEKADLYREEGKVHIEEEKERQKRLKAEEESKKKKEESDRIYQEQVRRQNEEDARKKREAEELQRQQERMKQEEEQKRLQAIENKKYTIRTRLYFFSSQNIDRLSPTEIYDLQTKLQLMLNDIFYIHAQNPDGTYLVVSLTHLKWLTIPWTDFFAKIEAPDQNDVETIFNFINTSGSPQMNKPTQPQSASPPPLITPQTQTQFSPNAYQPQGQSQSPSYQPQSQSQHYPHAPQSFPNTSPINQQQSQPYPPAPQSFPNISPTGYPQHITTNQSFYPQQRFSSPPSQQTPLYHNQAVNQPPTQYQPQLNSSYNQNLGPQLPFGGQMPPQPQPNPNFSFGYPTTQSQVRQQSPNPANTGGYPTYQ
ncbi:hypothetical protein BLNAU_710 [Blattamonas nauphoetae]|uniref:Uncharacterized protein n=1 Tax=Blattamonas nauphoetae TaxID=2049346 RepID=A0ABQ9YKB1_9EUKA|nr:hypothetical protein BLNAU_710 [Blattamonas nauphoetae]